MEQYIMKKKENRKVQRVKACALVFLCLAWLLPGLSGHTAYAENISAGNTVDVDLSWGSMSFTYTNGYTTWNPDTHKYDREVKAAWDTEDNYITVTNKGAAIKAELSSELMVSTVKGMFKGTPTAEGQPSYTMELEEGRKGTVYFELSGEIDTTYDYIGKIIVSIIAK